jgi:benzoyl-CoA reductase subunit C
VNRRLLDRLATIRRDTPWLVAVHEAYALVAAGGLIPKEEHNALLAYALSLIEKRDAQPQDRIRVVFEGGFCEQPPLDLLRALGQMCYVVDDDLLVGMRWIRGDVDPGGDPLHNLATAYLDQSTYSPVQHDLHKPKEEMLVQRMKDARAEAAVIAAAKMCEPGLDEQVAYAKALDAEGRAYFITEFEERMTGFENLQIQLETFVENVLFA